MGDQSQIMDLRTFGRTMLGRQPGYKPTKQELAADIALYKEYQKEAIKSARPGFTPSAVEVQAPWGGTLKMATTSPNSAQLVQDKAAWDPIRVTLQDGTIGLMDKNTAVVVPAWDVTTGKPVKAATKDSTGLIESQKASDMSQDIAKMQSQGAPWYRSEKGWQQDIATKQAQLNAMLNPASVLPGSPAPSSQPPTPTPKASPTPQATPTPDSAFLSSPVPSPSPSSDLPAPTPQASPISMSSADYQSKYGRAMKPGRYRTKSGAEVLITD